MIYAVLTLLGWIFIAFAIVTWVTNVDKRRSEASQLVKAIEMTALIVLAFVIFSQR